VSLVKAVSIKMLYAPAAFVLLWVEQYSLVIAYFDNSIELRLSDWPLEDFAGLALFAYIMQGVASRSEMVIEARKAA
jgi:hypothetical protein